MKVAVLVSIDIVELNAVEFGQGFQRCHWNRCDLAASNGNVAVQVHAMPHHHDDPGPAALKPPRPSPCLRVRLSDGASGS
jgi:hypothetical protein